jgi:indole-3-glycerol phosphate synthase
MPSRFMDALLNARVPIIMEVKRSDGEGAELMGERTIAEIVGRYVAVGAPCISVVTGRWFGGDDDMLREVAGLTDLPLLKKDFITREKQMVAAKEMGASAVLLTAKILPAKTFQHLIELALGHGLTPFVEVVDQAELESVTHPHDCVIAVNNKDINTREREPGDIDTSRSLLEATIQAGTPCPVSASAILDPRIAAELIDAGFRGLLIGTGLLRADSIEGWVEEFERHRAELGAPVGVGTHPPTPEPPASS